MSGLFGLFHKAQKKVQDVSKKQEIVANQLPKSKYDFVEQYTVVDPKRVMTDYSLFEYCANVPVACEDGAKSGGLINCHMLPTTAVMGFLKALQRMPTEKIADPKMRTIAIVHLAQNRRVVIGPSLRTPKTPVICPVDDDKDWILYVTPEKNRAMVEQLKLHTR